MMCPMSASDDRRVLDIDLASSAYGLASITLNMPKGGQPLGQWFPGSASAILRCFEGSAICATALHMLV